MNRHYLLLWAWRESTDTFVRRPVAFTGHKHEGMARAWNEFASEFPGWHVGGSITTRQHFEKLMELKTRESERWTALLR